MDYVFVQMLARLADNPEIDPHQDKVLLTSYQDESDGYAREDNRWIIAPGDTVDLDFDAFKDCDWLDLAVQNEGQNEAVITLTDDLGVAFSLPVPVSACLLLRCYKNLPKPQIGPSLASLLGTSVRIFAWGEHWLGEPV